MNSNSCVSTELYKLFSCLNAIKSVELNSVKAFMKNAFTVFIAMRFSFGKETYKITSREFPTYILSTYDISAFYTTLPHKITEDELLDLIDRTFRRGRFSTGVPGDANWLKLFQKLVQKFDTSPVLILVRMCSLRSSIIPFSSFLSSIIPLSIYLSSL